MHKYNIAINFHINENFQQGPWALRLLPLSGFTNEFRIPLMTMISSIWPLPYSEDAKDASIQRCDSDEIYVVALRVESGDPKYLNNVWVVGITGYFLDACNKEDVYLRWTGIQHQYRNWGLARQAIQKLIKTIHNQHPERKQLIELVPDNEYGREVAKPFFDKFGFTENTAIWVPPAEEETWKCIPYTYPLTKGSK